MLALRHLDIKKEKKIEEIRRILPNLGEFDQIPQIYHEKGKFLATALHHVPVHILKSSATAYLLFLPRSYAESLAQLLYHSALQFGVDVKSVAEWSMKK